MLEIPENNVGKIVWSLEKFYSVADRKMQTKKRPVLVIGHEKDYSDKFKVDYEVLPISTIGLGFVDEDFDCIIDEPSKYSLNRVSYVRSHKTSWINVKQMQFEQKCFNWKETFPEEFNDLLRKNHSWVQYRTNICTGDYDN